jgi:hypothetical protein
MEQRAAIKFCVKLKKTTTETFEMLKSSYGKNAYREQVCLNGIKGSKKGESHYKTMNGKAVLQLTEESTEVIPKAFGRRSNFEYSDVRRHDSDQ